MDRLVLGTRGSPLALWQAEHVAAALHDAHPGLVVELVRNKRSPAAVFATVVIVMSAM